MNQLKHFREKARLTRRELALAIGLTTAGAVEHYEAGRRNPPLEAARKIVVVLNRHGAECTLDSVFPPPKPGNERPDRLAR